MKYDKDLTHTDFKNLFGCPLSVESDRFITESDFSYRSASKEETEHLYIRYLDYLLSDIRPSGPNYHHKWEEGWGENLDLYIKSNDLKNLIPKFVKRNEFIRFRNEWISTSSSDFESNMVFLIREYIFNRYFSEFDQISEYGCGTGLNLVHLSKIFPSKKLIGLDWSQNAVRILETLKQHLNSNISGHYFDMFKPSKIDNTISSSNSAMFTIGAMEQLGQNFIDFFTYMMRSDYQVIVNIETIYEMYDKNLFFDYLPQAYILKRNWLRGYLPLLESYEKSGRIRILEKKKIFGSFFHDGYTVLAWEKIDV